jgi:exosortase A
MNASPTSAEAGFSGSSAVVARIRSLRAASAIALFIASLLSFWPTTSSLLQRWEDLVWRTYTHGYAIVLITLWLLWRNRAGWTRVPAAPSLTAFVALLAVSLAWLVAFRAGLQVVHQGLLPIIVFLVVAACYGLRATWQHAFAFGYFYFAVPVWDALIPPLQAASVFATRLLLRMVGIPVYFSGNTFTMPAGSLEIAGGCSGLHFFIVAFAIALLYGELNGDSRRTRVKLVAFALGLALVTNWLRIFIIAVAGHLTDMQHPLVSEDHYTFGWMMFAGAMVVFFLVVRRWPVQDAQASPEADDMTATRVVAWPGVALALAGLLIGPGWLLLDENRASAGDAAEVLPESVPGWSAETSMPVDWRPVFVGADVQQGRRYVRASATTVDAFAALYLSQQQGKELLGYDNSPAGEGWNIRAQGAAGRWSETVAVDDTGNTWLLWHGYRIDGQWQRPGVSLQLNYGLRSLWSAPLSTVIALRTPCASDDCSAARVTLGSFAHDAWPGSGDDSGLAPGDRSRSQQLSGNL